MKILLGVPNKIKGCALLNIFYLISVHTLLRSLRIKLFMTKLRQLHLISRIQLIFLWVLLLISVHLVCSIFRWIRAPRRKTISYITKCAVHFTLYDWHINFAHGIRLPHIFGHLLYEYLRCLQAWSTNWCFKIVFFSWINTIRGVFSSHFIIIHLFYFVSIFSILVFVKLLILTFQLSFYAITKIKIHWSLVNDNPRLIL